MDITAYRLETKRQNYFCKKLNFIGIGIVLNGELCKREGKVNNKLFVDIFNELLKPVSIVLIVSLAGLGWALAIQLMKEVIELRTKLGRETHQENFSEWFIRNSAPIVFPIYSLKKAVMNLQINLKLNQFLTMKRIRKLILQLD